MAELAVQFIIKAWLPAVSYFFLIPQNSLRLGFVKNYSNSKWLYYLETSLPNSDKRSGSTLSQVPASFRCIAAKIKHSSSAVLLFQ